MKKTLCTAILLILTLALLTSCSESVGGYFQTVSNQVTENMETLMEEVATEETKDYFYSLTEVGAKKIEYGYYYSANNEARIPNGLNVKCNSDLGEPYEMEGGFCFGEPDSGESWCFVKKITDNWFYYEIHN